MCIRDRINDLSLFPENQMIDLALQNGIGFGQERSAEIEDRLDIVDLALLPWEQARKKLQFKCKLAARQRQV